MIFSSLLATALAAPTVDPTTTIRVALFGTNEKGDACYYVENDEGRLAAIVADAMFFSNKSYFNTFNHNSAKPKIYRQTQRGDIYDYEIDIDVASLVNVAKRIGGGLQSKESRTWLNNHVEAAVLGYVKDVALNFADGKWTADVRLLGAEGFEFDIVPERALYSFSSPVLKQLEQKIPLCFEGASRTQN
jgi:hypothetical protein